MLYSNRREALIFKQAIIHYPTDERALYAIEKEIAAFRCAAAVKYIESLNLSDRQIKALYTRLDKVIAANQQAGA